MTRPKPVVLAILDGWGEQPDSPHNAITRAKTPHWDALKTNFPHGVIHASELEVGLPEGQMGNSEVGHMNIGAGRVVMQDLPRINQAIRDGSLEKNPQLQAFINKLKASGGACHLLGLLSSGGVHSHQDHLAALATVIAKAGISVWVHAFLDGRDTPPRSAKDYLATFLGNVAQYPHIKIATLSGRYFAMDRDKRWDRVQKAYAAMVEQGGECSSTPIDRAYEANISDEFILPCRNPEFDAMKDGDGLLMVNFRADRARQILTAFLDPDFKGFPRNKTVQFAATLGMVEYSSELAPLMPALFPPTSLKDIFGEVISKAGLTQLRIAETEKYAHVTFFFNGGQEAEFAGESRILVPSPKVATYDLQPEMSAPQVTDALVDAIMRDQFDVIVVNYANTDMVGHTGNVPAAIKAVETVDTCLGRLSEAVLAKDGALVITADHGNAEAMFDHHTDQPHTAHTLNLVPVVIIAEALRSRKMHLREGRLADIAPTLLALLQLPQPEAMTGCSLLDAISYA